VLVLRVQLLRIGPNITGVQYEDDANFWPLRMELGAVSFFSRTLLPEEWYLAAMSPPAPIEQQALPFTQITLPPLSLPTGGNFIWVVYPPSFFGSNVTLYLGASEPGAFSAGTDVSAETDNQYLSARKLVWNKVAAGAAGGTTVIQSMQLQMPLSSGCVNYTSWTAGDTAHYRSVILANFTICVSTLEFLQSQIVVQLNLTAPPSPPTRYPYISKSESPPLGLAQFRTATSDNIDFKKPAGRLAQTSANLWRL
jgi:hypothetical protein